MIKHSDAVQLIAIKRANFTNLTSIPEARKYTNTGLVFLQYLDTNWLDQALWSSWSQHGRNLAQQG